MTSVSARSPAKINLTLRVLGTRPDGFHEIESLVALVDFCDTVEITPQERGRWRLATDSAALAPDSRNLVLRAARALVEATGDNPGIDVRLTKRIPLGAGLGGGSSNAATALRLLNELWSLKLSNDELARIGARLGSDVPLFFHGPLCVLRGRGERIERRGERLRAWVALLLPDLQVATPAVYRTWDQLHRGDASAAPRAAQASETLQTALARLETPEALMAVLQNDLESAAFRVEPRLAALHARAEAWADGPVRMTGSGAGLFRLFGDEAAARRFAAAAVEPGVRGAVAAVLERGVS